MTWQLEVKSDKYPTWHAVGTVQYRNVLGNAVNEGTVTTGASTAYPGVLRWHVTEVQGGPPPTTILATKAIIYPADIHNPGIMATPGAFAIGDPLQTSACVGDEFDIAVGYVWDESAALWQPVRHFGLLVPGLTGTTMSVRITSLFSAPQAFCSMAWSNNGDINFFAAQVNSNGWISAASTPTDLYDDGNVHGLISPGGQCIVDFRPEPSEDMDNTDNPITLTISLSSSSV